MLTVRSKWLKGTDHEEVVMGHGDVLKVMLDVTCIGNLFGRSGGLGKVTVYLVHVSAFLLCRQPCGTGSEWEMGAPIQYVMRGHGAHVALNSHIHERADLATLLATWQGVSAGEVEGYVVSTGQVDEVNMEATSSRQEGGEPRTGRKLAALEFPISLHAGLTISVNRTGRGAVYDEGREVAYRGADGESLQLARHPHMLVGLKLGRVKASKEGFTSTYHVKGGTNTPGRDCCIGGDHQGVIVARHGDCSGLGKVRLSAGEGLHRLFVPEYLCK